MLLIECPSGLKGEMRGLTVAEEDLILQFSSGGKAKTDEAFKKLLSRCWVRTVDVGPYSNMTPEQPLDVDEILVCDTFYMMLQLRVLSYGNELDVRSQCPNGHGWEATIDLAGIKVYDLPQDSRDRLAKGIPFETTLPVTGRTVKYKLLFYGDEVAAIKNLKSGRDDVSTETLRLRIVEISGFDPQTHVDTETGLDIRNFIRSLPVADSSAIRDAMDDVDGGVETEYEAICDQCDALSMVSIEQAVNFFGARKGRKKRGSRPSRT
ncbi:MAG TPA: hypothetical protein VM492_16910 [Sumerlaeia bacterium]|nr:hypothetical protein [Sumerlaeia bacterium]